MKNVIRNAPLAIGVLVNVLLIADLTIDLYQNTIKPRIRKAKIAKAKEDENDNDDNET